MTAPAPAPAPSPALRTRRHAIGDHTLIHGDALRVLGRMEAGSIDVVITSPPYNLGLAYSTYRDRRTEADYLDWMTGIGTAIARVLRDDGSFFLNIAGSSQQPWLPFELAIRLRAVFALQNHISWIKSIAIDDVTHGHFKPVNSHRFVNRNHEHVFHFTKTGDVGLARVAAGVPFTDKSNIARRGHAQDRRCRGDTWFIPYETVQAKRQKFFHPGTFPVALPAACLALHGAGAGATVLDPFMGTGTTLIAAHRAGARATGIDSDAGYVRTARARLRDEIAPTS